MGNSLDDGCDKVTPLKLSTAVGNPGGNEPVKLADLLPAAVASLLEEARLR